MPAVGVLFFFYSIQAGVYFSAWIVYDFVTSSFMCAFFVQEGGLVWQQSTVSVMCI